MKKLQSYFLLTLCLIIAALNFNLILKPLELVTGGTQGFALLINNIIKIKPSIIILIINVITLIISYFCLSKTTVYGTIAASFIYPVSVKLTSFIPVISFFESHVLLSSIIAGVICGITGGFIYKLGFSAGGVSTINLIVNKYLKIKVALSNLIINILIIVLGCFIFGLTKGFYSVIVIFISSIFINIIIKSK